MDICYPADTDWGCKFSPTQISEMRADAVKAKAMERSEGLAWQTLAALTGYQVGVCPILVRPCAAGVAGGSWMEAPVSGGSMAGLPAAAIGTFSPYLSGGNWYNACGCGSSATCGCSSISEVILPAPVGSIERVVVSGEVIEPSRYRVDDGYRLVSTDPELRWPVRQNIAAGPDDPGAFSISLYQGAAPNDQTRYAAGMLAAEFFKACLGEKCSLPRKARTVARSNGTTYDIKSSLFEGGMTGIDAVDALIMILNPHGLRAPVVVTSPDAGDRGRRQTWGSW